MRNGENKKVIFGSMIETVSGGDGGENFLGRGITDGRQPRTAMKQPSGLKARGMSQAPSLGQKKLDGQDVKGA
jgi:hypothetical protein